MSAKPSSLRFSAKAQGALGWALAAAALVGGWWAYGAPGVALAVTVVVFWLLLQFSQAMRTLRIASQRPVGVVPSAVMLNARLHAGLRLPQVLRLTLSLGRRVSGTPGEEEVLAWADEAGHEVQVTLLAGRVQQWQLQRAEAPAEPQAPT